MNPSITPTPVSMIPGMNFSQGTVISPGGVNLGYVISPIDGVKVFSLFVQPITHTLLNMNDYLNQNYTPFMSPDLSSMQIPSGGSSEILSYFPGFGQVGYNYTAYEWGYNGHSPGPVIEAMLGDTIRINLTNELPENTTLHIDGMIRDWEDDGWGGVSEAGILPGTSHVYQIKLTQCGSFLYHSGYQSWKQDRRGLYGHLIVHCPGIEPQVTWDYSIMVSAMNTFGDLSAFGCKGWAIPQIDWWLFNGHTSPTFPPLKANSGDSVRIRFINPITDFHHPVHLNGHEWRLISIGGPLLTLPAPLNSSTVDLVAGVGKDVIFTARAGIWRLRSCSSIQLVNNYEAYSVDSALQLAPDGGMLGIFCVSGATNLNNITCNF